MKPNDIVPVRARKTRSLHRRSLPWTLTVGVGDVHSARANATATPPVRASAQPTNSVLSRVRTAGGDWNGR